MEESLKVVSESRTCGIVTNIYKLKEPGYKKRSMKLLICLSHNSQEEKKAWVLYVQVCMEEPLKFASKSRTCGILTII